MLALITVVLIKIIVIHYYNEAAAPSCRRRRTAEHLRVETLSPSWWSECIWFWRLLVQPWCVGQGGLLC